MIKLCRTARGRRVFVGRSAALALTLAWAAAGTCQAAEPPGAGASESPPTLMLRVPVGASFGGAAEMRKLADGWLGSGRATRVVWLEAGAQPTPDFAALAIVDFPTDAALAAWRGRFGTLLPKDTRVRRVDVLGSGANAAYDPRPAVFENNVYQLTTSPDRYREFAAGYIAPLMEIQRSEKLLLAWTLYVERTERSGEPAQSVLVKAYRDAAAFGTIGPVNDQLRARLTAKHPTYPGFHQTKDTLRTNVSETLARWVTPPADSLPVL
jgi:hypothetical protein